MRRNRKTRLLMMLPIGIAGLVVFGLVIMALWNALLPAVFGWKQIGFWQAIGLFILCRLLFGGLGGGGHRHRHGRRLREGWARMTPEEREKIRDAIRARYQRPEPPEPRTAG